MQVVITGTSRGIGLALTRLALEAGHHVLAAARDPERSTGIGALRQQHGDRLRLATVDVRDPQAGPAIAKALAPGTAVDILIHNAGILREGSAREDFIESFTVNTIAPFEITQALLPLLRKAKQPRVMHLSSKMGSIAETSAGGRSAYRSSKAALNMINRTLTCEHPWLTAIVVHPGWVSTDMGGRQAPVAVADSARGLWNLVDELQPQAAGRFLDYQGRELLW